MVGIFYFEVIPWLKAKVFPEIIKSKNLWFLDFILKTRYFLNTHNRRQ